MNANRYSRGSVIRLGLIGVPTGIFVASAFFAAAFDRFPGDLPVSVWVQSWNAPWFGALASAVSLEENRLIILPMMMLVVAGLFFLGWRRESYLLLGSTLTGALITEVAKALITRPRPAHDLLIALQDVTSHSFPSGNVSLFSVYLIALAYVVASRTLDRRKAIAAWGIATVLLGLIGFGRIYLGVHWLSDVLGGYLLGITWVLATVQIEVVSVF